MNPQARPRSRTMCCDRLRSTTGWCETTRLIRSSHRWMGSIGPTSACNALPIRLATLAATGTPTESSCWNRRPKISAPPLTRWRDCNSNHSPPVIRTVSCNSNRSPPVIRRVSCNWRRRRRPTPALAGRRKR